MVAAIKPAAEVANKLFEKNCLVWYTIFDEICLLDYTIYYFEV